MNDKLGLFEVINLLFTNKEGLMNLSDNILNHNSFMINRTMGIKYPLQSQAFNVLKINSPDVIKFWCDYLGGKTYVPSFVRTQGAKKSATLVKKKKSISDNDIRTFCKYNNVSKKDIISALELYNDEMIKEINDFINSITEK